MSCSSAAALSSRSQMRPLARSAPLARREQDWTMAALAPGLRRSAIAYSSGADTRGGYSDTLYQVSMSVTDRKMPLAVMAGLVPVIHAVQLQQRERVCAGASAESRWIACNGPHLAHGVDGRDKPGHDGIG